MELVARLNSDWHKPALAAFMAVVLAHLGEHLVQSVQIVLFQVPRSLANGIVGVWFPELIKSELLHYGYALLMLVGLLALRPAFSGRPGGRLWDAALAIQLFHFFEHFLLFYQAQSGNLIFGTAQPSSLVQLFVPRFELHLVYNFLVFFPMLLALLRHKRAPRARKRCSC